MADLGAPLLVAERTGSSASLGVLHSGRTLTLLPLVTLIFFEVSGGPFGTEDAVAAAGPLLCLLGFIVFPILWSVPEALITAELATAFPENSGYVAWVTAAFGPFWGFQEGLWSWISGVADNSLYPVMLAANLELWFPQLAGGWPRAVFLVGMSLALSLLNYRGLTVVGHTVVTSTLAILLPFVVMCAFSVPHMNMSNLVQVDWKTVDWSTFLNVMFWNLNYWDSVSTLAGEVRDPARTFPKALLLAVVLVVLFYLVPTACALGVLGAQADGWQLGYYGQVATQVGGPWLAAWILVAAACSQIGQYQAEMASDSYQVQGMAERGFLPKALGARSRYGTPIWGILLSSMGVLLLASMSFVEIVTLLNAIYCMAELLEFAAFVWLRYKAPEMHRPYRVPLPAWGLVLMLLPASMLLLTVLAMPVWQRDWRTIASTLAAVAAGLIIYPMLQTARNRGWCEFEPFDYYCMPGVNSGGWYVSVPTSEPSATGMATKKQAQGPAPPGQNGARAPAATAPAAAAAAREDIVAGKKADTQQANGTHAGEHAKGACEGKDGVSVVVDGSGDSSHDGEHK